MHTMSNDPGAHPLPSDAERARARLNRIAAPAQSPNHLIRSETRDTLAFLRPRRHGMGKRESFRLGWGGWLVIELIAIAIAAAGYLTWTPTSACREQEAKLGFYAGDSLGKCIRRGIAARIDDIDQRLKMLVRGSGR
ncbi:hypothetical protein FV226_23455 [Methylobacterium sp. WL12]|uniref:hypothetical protein n=1 Tax=Methylobacterium sp. WL12 TaxID=2603890 RepID=UPI0011CC903E|nr:hypothetical protein [Methylobacterium sp. WL12]TXM66451.1 hypothetical protein FV226_23455 [Methylobacterium sp. WL12]